MVNDNFSIINNNNFYWIATGSCFQKPPFSKVVSLLARLTLDAQGGVMQQRVAAMRRRRPCLASLIAQGLLLPFLGRFLGDHVLARLVLQPRTPVWCRVLAGSVTFLALRAGACVVLRYAQLARQATRHILDFSAPSSSSSNAGDQVANDLVPVVDDPQQAWTNFGIVDLFWCWNILFEWITRGCFSRNWQSG